jgi:SAM-dependent methyltransferase
VYSKGFFESRQEASQRSAGLVLPAVFEIVGPSSVVDFGCGTGTWLEAAKRLGASRVLGIEGAWISKAKPLIASNELKVFDLSSPIELGERFDLAISLEVAEHLPPARAAGFVADITRASDVVLFGAAIPEQGGTGHVNEQWQSYWAKLFRDRGYHCFDVVRPRFWENADVLPWYKQNAFLYVNDTARARIEQRLPADVAGRERPVDLVHPDLYTRLVRDPPFRLGARITWAFAGKVVRKALGLSGPKSSPPLL